MVDIFLSYVKGYIFNHSGIKIVQSNKVLKWSFGLTLLLWFLFWSLFGASMMLLSGPVMSWMVFFYATLILLSIWKTGFPFFEDYTYFVARYSTNKIKFKFRKLFLVEFATYLPWLFVLVIFKQLDVVLSNILLIFAVHILTEKILDSGRSLRNVYQKIALGCFGLVAQLIIILVVKNSVKIIAIIQQMRTDYLLELVSSTNIELITVINMIVSALMFVLMIIMSLLMEKRFEIKRDQVPDYRPIIFLFAPIIIEKLGFEAVIILMLVWIFLYRYAKTLLMVSYYSKSYFVSGWLVFKRIIITLVYTIVLFIIYYSVICWIVGKNMDLLTINWLKSLTFLPLIYFDTVVYLMIIKQFKKYLPMSHYDFSRRIGVIAICSLNQVILTTI